MLKTLIDNDFVSHYNIHPIHLTATEHVTSQLEFDLIDEDDANSPILPKGQGYVTLQQSYGQIGILLYDDFYKNIQSPKSIKEGVKHCDFVLSSPNNECICLIELTSSTGSVAGLSAPIKNKKHQVIFSRGKYEKAEVQLSDSLKMLTAVQTIKTDFDRKHRKICLMAYQIIPYPSSEEQIKRPFSRYLDIESKMTRDNGAIISCPDIEQYGFEYRRIGHDYVFTL